jgi:cellulose synthase/poly-beta-1,6-N-acetylglucosamine synthase-like glycosyltransferase
MATRDGARTLPRVLDAYRRLEPPAGGWRLVVVDNGSGDATPEILDDAARRLPLVVLREPRVGKSRALNRGAEEVVGDLVVFTDDDAVPGTRWLSTLREAADRHPECAVFVGTVTPRFEEPLPAEVAGVRQEPMFGRVEHEAEGLVRTTDGVGANFAVRIAALPPRPWFREDLGPDGTDDFAMGEESELLLRLERAGAGAWYAKEAAVEHVVAPAHAEPASLLARAYRHGRGCGRLGIVRPGGPRVGGLPLPLWVEVLRRRRRLARARRRGDERHAFRSLWHLAFLAGRSVEAAAARSPERTLPRIWPLLPGELRAVLPRGGTRASTRHSTT